MIITIISHYRYNKQSVMDNRDSDSTVKDNAHSDATAQKKGPPEIMVGCSRDRNTKTQ